MASYFKNSYKYEWENTDSIKAINKYYDVSQSFELEVSLPKLFCYAWNGSSWEKLFQMNSITRVYRTLMQRQENGEYLPKGEREKLGDILVDEEGADIFAIPEMLKYNIETEKIAIKEYRRLIEMTDCKCIKNILERIIKDEENHIRAFKTLQEEYEAKC